MTGVRKSRAVDLAFFLMACALLMCTGSLARFSIAKIGVPPCPQTFNARGPGALPPQNPGGSHMERSDIVLVRRTDKRDPCKSSGDGRWRLRGTIPSLLTVGLLPALPRTRLESCPEYTKPDSLRVYLFATPHNHRSPPA